MTDETRDDQAAASSLPQENAMMADEVLHDPPVLRLLAEELSITKQKIETARVKVKVVTRNHEELVDVPLTRESVAVERIPIGRPVDEIPPIRQEGDTTIVPVVEETLVVERRLTLKEELHVRRIRTTEQYRESVILRKQEAEITRIPVEPPATDPSQDGSVMAIKEGR